MFFEFFVTKLCFHDKPNQKNRKLRPVAFQRYRSELLTPNRFRERSDKSSGLDFDFRQNEWCTVEYKETQRKTKEMQVVLFNWSFDENEKQDLNYHRTVLGDYWELEARTGTVGKLQVSTFSFSECFLRVCPSKNVVRMAKSCRLCPRFCLILQDCV